MTNDLSEENVKRTLAASTCRTDWAKALGYSYLNGKVGKALDDLISRFNLDCSHFDLNIKNRKYQIVEKKCPVCGIQFKTKSGHSREKTTCSQSCSNTHFASIRHTEESKLKRSNTLRSKYGSTLIGSIDEKYPLERIRVSKKRELKKLISFYEKICFFCHTSFVAKKLKTKFCSGLCVQKNLIAEGRHTGWRSRDKCNRSWAEKYVEEKILNPMGYEKDIHFKTDFPQGKWFIDFAFVNRKIAIEIDGKQHEYPDRQIKDAEKDAWLQANGWTVHRIKWKRITKETRDALISSIELCLKEKI